MNAQKTLATTALLALMGFGAHAEDLKSHTEMHKNMAKAHEQAAKCLEEGKPLEECRAQFREACGSAGGPGWCGKGMGKGRGHGRGKGQGPRQ